MTIVLEALQWLNLMAAALGAGGQLFVLLTVVRAHRHWPPALSAKVHRDAFTVLPDIYMKPVAGIALLTAVAIAGLERSGVPTALMLAGALGQAANGIISARWEWPINNEVNSWAEGVVPDHYPRLRDAWNQKHAWRTIASLIALACFILAAILRQRA